MVIMCRGKGEIYFKYLSLGHKTDKLFLIRSLKVCSIHDY